MRHEIMFFGLQHMLPKPHYEFCCPGNKRMSFFRPRRFGSGTILQSIPRSRNTVHCFHRMRHDWNIHSSRTYLVVSATLQLPTGDLYRSVLVPTALAVGIESSVITYR